MFNFTIKAIPPLIDEVLQASGARPREDVDYFIFHQSNRFIINHLVHKCGLEASKTHYPWARSETPEALRFRSR